MGNIPRPLESKEPEINTSKTVLRPLLFVAALAAVGLGLVYASSASAVEVASRFWINSVTAETTPSN